MFQRFKSFTLRQKHAIQLTVGWQSPKLLMDVRIIHRVPYRSVAQLFRATALGAVGRWLKPSYSDQIGVSSNGKTWVFDA